MQIQTPPQTINDIRNTSLETLRQLRAATGIQSKSSRLPPLVRTYSQKLRVKVAQSAHKLFQRAREPIVGNEGVQIPKGAKLLSIQTSSFSEMGEVGISEDTTAVVSNKDGDDSMQDHPILQVWGVPWTPLEFIEEAVKAGHPMQLQSCLPPRLTKLVASFNDFLVLQRLQWRIDRLRHWSARRNALREAEKELHRNMHPDVDTVLRAKNILVWKEMLQAIQCEDMGVVDEFTSGSALVGEAEITNLCPKRFSPATTMTISELKENACKERP